MATVAERLRKGRTAVWDGEKLIDRQPSSQELCEAADLIDLLTEALRPFANLAQTKTVQDAMATGWTLSLENGLSLCAVDARDFVKAQAARQKAEQS